ncbi:RING finger protein 208-like [Dunckerocampus dactyliophorus]|uniref:RING finger protein 208-like n=1 Tax=Dunckerocampus dactyliophorus TaxID=161453 RepID=UPI002404FFCD|nr:RING finger protein 208-like [Dunckerocampus dactyliophorus]
MSIVKDYITLLRGNMAGKAEVDSSVAEEYECTICYNLFDVERHAPKMLSCSHTFCLECLEAVYTREGRGWRIGCPLCRHRTPVPQHIVQELPDNTAVADKLSPGKPMHTADEEERIEPIAQENRCQTCAKVAFIAACMCTLLSFSATVVLVLVGLFFMHNVKSSKSVGALCLVGASVLALFSLILTWLTCMLKHPS